MGKAHSGDLRARVVAAMASGRSCREAGWIAERLADTPELTLEEVRRDLVGRGVEVSYASVWRTVRRLGLRQRKDDLRH